MTAGAGGKNRSPEENRLMRILFFGRLGEKFGREMEIELSEEVKTVAALRAELARHPLLGPELLAPTVRACVGDALVPDDTILGEASEVAFLPPLSGG